MLNGFVITKVCYNDNTTRDSIKSVKAARFNSEDERVIDMIGNMVSWSRSQIIGMITDESEKIRVYTATVEDDKYILGSEVEVCNCYGQILLRTKGSTLTRDDFDAVPVYVAHC